MSITKGAALIRERRLSEVWRLLEEIRHVVFCGHCCVLLVFCICILLNIFLDKGQFSVIFLTEKDDSTDKYFFPFSFLQGFTYRLGMNLQNFKNYTFSFFKKKIYKKVCLKNPKTIRKC